MPAQDYFETAAHIEGGRLKVHGQRVFEQAMMRFENGPVTVKVTALVAQRSHKQNRYWWGVVVPLFAEHCGCELAEMHDALCLELLPSEITDVMTGEVRTVPGHTSRLSVQGFNDLIARAQRLGASLDIYVPDPNEVPVRHE